MTSRNNGSCSTYLCNAGPGYDGPTGLGTPCGTGAFGGAISSPGGCGGSASAGSGASPATAPLKDYVPACRTAPPGGVRCAAYVRAGVVGRGQGVIVAEVRHLETRPDGHATASS